MYKKTPNKLKQKYRKQSCGTNRNKVTDKKLEWET